MKTDLISKLAVYFMCLFLIAPDAIASSRVFIIGIPSNQFELPVRGIHFSYNGLQELDSDFHSEEVDHNTGTRRVILGPRSVVVNEQRALLGQSSLDPMNNPRDDFFSFNLNEEDLMHYSHVIISYDVKGLAKGEGLVKAINDHQAYGDLINIVPSDQWSRQREVVAVNQFYVGTNYMRFGLPDGRMLQAQVQNFEVELSNGNVKETEVTYLGEQRVEDPHLFTYRGEQVEKVQMYALNAAQAPSIPTDITNVTKGANSYRLRTDTLLNDGLIGVAIDLERLPAGKTPKDVSTFYFNFNQRGWVPVSVDSVHIDNEEDIAINFVPLQPGTQYFNGVISTPNMPESSANLSTSLGHVSPPSPATGIASIAPPQLSRTGDATTSFPIKIPAGRNGMQPGLAITYNSSAGTGWLGVGWNISIPKIVVDTRWGVPEYDETYQTEIYSLDGQMLNQAGQGRPNRIDLNTPTASLPSRVTGEVPFFESVRSSWREIKRKGSGPGDYTWEVTNSDQTTYYYGLRDGLGEIINSSVLKDPTTGNISEWNLSKVVDKWGNAIHYHYNDSPVSGTATIPNLLVDAQQRVLNRITYTGFDDGTTSTLGNYVVYFNSSEPREDATVHMRYGFKVANAQQLQSIIVQYGASGQTTAGGTGSTEIRNYQLNYRTVNDSTFYKSQLSSISERKGSNTFYTFSFDYYDPTYTFDANAVSIGGSSSYNELGRTETEGYSAGGAAGVGFGGSPKINYVGAEYNHSWSNEWLEYTMLDVTGDGISDAIHSTAGNVLFNRGYLDDNGHFKLSGSWESFSGSAPGYRIHTKSSGDQYSIAGGFGVSEALSFTAGVAYNNSVSETEHYFADLNSDGITDWVENGKVSFGSLDLSTGEIRFEDNSRNTPNPIVNLVDITVPEEEDLQTQSFETVRSWRAPFDGTVNITSSATLSSLSDDQVYVQIDHAEATTSTTLFTTPTLANNTPTPVNLTNVEVAKGDMLFFRVNGLDNPKYDFVEWDPQVSYSFGNLKDANGIDYGIHNPSDEYTLFGNDGLHFVGDEEVKVSWSSVALNTPTDEVVLEVIASLDDGSTITVERAFFEAVPNFTGSAPSSSATTTFNTTTTWIKELIDGTGYTVPAGSTLDVNFIIRARTNVSWSLINWRPSLEVTSNGQTKTIYAVVDKQFFGEPLAVEQPASFSSMQSSTLHVVPNLDNQIFSNLPLNQGSYEADFTVKTQGDYLLSYHLSIDPNQALVTVTSNDDLFEPIDLASFSNSCGNGTLINQIDVVNDELYFEYTTDDEELSEQLAELASVDCYIAEVLGEDCFVYYDIFNNKASVYLKEPYDFVFSNVLGWGVFGWAGNSDPISIENLEPMPTNDPQFETAYDNVDDGTLSDFLQFTETNDIGPFSTTHLFRAFAPERGENVTNAYYSSIGTIGTAQLDRWRMVYNEFGSVFKDQTSNGVTGVDPSYEPTPPSYVRVNNYNRSAVVNRSVAHNASLYGSGKFKLDALKDEEGTSSSSVSVGGSTTYPFHEINGIGAFQRQAMFDMNGDGYPDAVASNAQKELSWSPTTALGGYASSSLIELDDNAYISRNRFTSYGPRIGYGYASGDQSTQYSGGASGSASFSSSAMLNGLLDFNGDGLPDFYISPETSEFGSSTYSRVRLGNGRGLESATTLEDVETSYTYSTGDAYTTGASLGAGLGFGSPDETEQGMFDFSRSGNFTWHSQHSQRMFRDMNRDGLADLVYKSGSEWRVKFNNGTGFSTSKGYTNSNLELGNQTQNLVLALRHGLSIPLPFSVVSSVNVGVNSVYNNGGADVNSSIQDMNGDGFPDLVEVDDDEVQVYYNQDGKAGLLKTIYTPLGGEIAMDYELKGNRYGMYPAELYNHQFDPDEGEPEMFWDMGYSKWVLSSVSVSDGFNPTTVNDGADVYTTHFAYDGGMHSRRERKFIGFTRVASYSDEKTGQDSENLTSMDILQSGYSIVDDVKLQNWRIIDFKKVASTSHQDRVAYEYQSSLVDATYSVLKISTMDDPDWVDEWVTLSVSRNSYHNLIWTQLGDDAGKVDPTEPELSDISEVECFYPQLIEREQFSFLDESRYYNAVKTTYSYNNYGNVTRMEVFGQDEVSTASFGDSPYSYVDSEGVTHIYQWYVYNPVYVADIIVLNDYYSPDLAADRVGVLSRSRLFTETTALSNLKRVTRYSLRSDKLEIETVTKYLDVNETDGVGTSYVFDSYGNVTQVTPQQKADGDALQINITYDGTESQYPTVIQKVLTDVGGPHSRTETTYNNFEISTGLIRKTLDINGLPTEYYYDQFQRPEKIFGPRELEQGPYTLKFEYFNPYTFSTPLSETNLPWAIAHQYTGNSAASSEIGDWRTVDYYNDIDVNIADVSTLYASSRSESVVGVQFSDYVRTSVVVDGLGRSIQAMQEVSGENDGENEKAVLFSGRVQYDIWGQPMIGYRFGNVTPSDYTDFEELKTFHDDVVDSWSNVQSFSYVDTYNRLSESYSRNATDVNKTSTSKFTRSLADREWFYDPDLNKVVLLNTITLEGDPTSVTKSMTDSRGRTYKIQEVDVNGGAFTTYTTEYDLDLLHQMNSVTDPLGLVTTYSYDLFGRVETTTHPDKGVMTAVYDNVGNVNQIRIQDAETASSTITMEMEYAYNRMVAKTFPTSSDINDVSIVYGTLGDGVNGAGRPVAITQGHANSEVLIDEFAYDDLGNRAREKRQIAVPFAGEYTFKTDYTFDSWGRVNHMRYPDGEMLTYTYAPGGEMETMQTDAGFRAEYAGKFIDHILYDGYGSKATIMYGNGVERTFEFDPETRALEASTLNTSNNNADFSVFSMLDKTFEYNASGNVSRIENTAGALGASYNHLGGDYEHNYTYDAFNRLVAASGDWNELSDGTTYTLAMTYDEAGRILSKNQLFTGNYSGSSVNLSYDYTENEFKHFPNAITDAASSYQYDLNFDLRGNMVQKQRTFGEQIKVSKYLWDEADRMIAASEENGNIIQHNVYDYQGTRIMRGVATNQGLWENNEGIEDWSLSPYTIYAGPHYVFDMYKDDVDITKHYYGDNRRVASRTQMEERYYLEPGHEPGNGPFFNFPDLDYEGAEYPDPVAAPINNIVISQWDYISTELENENISVSNMSAIGIAEYSGSYSFLHEDCTYGEYPELSFEDEYCQCRNNRDLAIANGIPCPQEFPSIFWYHGDLGGSTEFVTDLAGMPYEHYFYAPFGEVVVSQHINNDGYSNPYKFASTEHDAVTGLVLMGHRYYDPTFSIWVSADPLFMIEDWLSPYTYVRNNPVMFMDPLGLTSLDKGTGPVGPPVNPEVGDGWCDDITGTEYIWTGELWQSQNDKTDNFGGIIADVTVDAEPDLWGKLEKNSKAFVFGLQRGFDRGLDDTFSFVESLGTLQGWKDLGNSTLLMMDAASPFASPEGLLYRQQLFDGISETIDEIPNWGAYDYGFAFGYLGEKTAEAVILKKACVPLRGGGAARGSNYVNLASRSRTAHIIAGDATGGGHAWFGSTKSFMNGLTGRKSMFPATWSNSKIMNGVSEVVTSNPWVQQTGSAGAMFTRSGQPVRFVTEGYYNGLKIRVINTHSEIITAFPIR